MMMEYGLRAWNMNFVLFYVTRRIVIIIIFLLRKSVWSVVYKISYCVGAGMSTLMSISDGLGSYLFRRKMEKT